MRPIIDQAGRLQYTLCPNALVDMLIERRSGDSSMSLPLVPIRLSIEALDLQKEKRGVFTVPTLGPKILSISSRHV